MHDLGWCIIGKSMVDLLFPLIELTSLSVAVPELWGEMCTARLFSQGVDSLRSNFTWTETSPINHFWHQKTRDGMLQDSEDRIPLCSLILTQYRSVTDRQLDGYAVAYTMLAKPALQHTAKNQYKKSAWPDTPSEQACWLARVIQLSLRRGGVSGRSSMLATLHTACTLICPTANTVTAGESISIRGVRLVISYHCTLCNVCVTAFSSIACNSC